MKHILDCICDVTLEADLKLEDPQLAYVAVGSLGGTISMTTAESGGVQPTLSAEALLQNVPGLSEIADISANTLKTIPGASLQLDDVLDVVKWAKAQVASKGAAGVVVVQGTDTLEETAYLAELCWDEQAPLVFTGAMRPAHSLSPDGAANIMAACTVAASPSTQGLGTLVVMNETIHSAHRVYKGHTFALDAMRSRGGHLAGILSEGTIHLNAAQPNQGSAVDIRGSLADFTVPIVPTYLGDTGDMLEKALELQPDGLVIAGFGVGHIPERVAHLLEPICKRIPVVYTSRVPDGVVGTRTYSFAGSEMNLKELGAVPGGMLSPVKARLLLTALLASNLPASEILDTVKRYIHV